MREETAQTKAFVRQYLLENRYRCYVGPLLFYFIADLLTGFLPMSVFTGTDTMSNIFGFGLSFILNALLTMLSVGLMKISLDLLRGENVSLQSMFFVFKERADQFVIVSLILTAIKTVFSFSLIIVNSFYPEGTEVDIYYYIAYYGCSMAVLFLTMLCTLRLFWAFYFLLDGEAYSAGEALKKSLAFSKGKTLTILYMKVSFAGYYILSVLSFMTGFLYEKPYAEMTYAKFYLDHK